MNINKKKKKKENKPSRQCWILWNFRLTCYILSDLRDRMKPGFPKRVMNLSAVRHSCTRLKSLLSHIKLVQFQSHGPKVPAFFSDGSVACCWRVWWPSQRNQLQVCMSQPDVPSRHGHDRVAACRAVSWQECSGELMGRSQLVFPFLVANVPIQLHRSSVFSLFKVFETVQQAHDVPFGSYFEVSEDLAHLASGGWLTSALLLSVIIWRSGIISCEKFPNLEAENFPLFFVSVLPLISSVGPMIETPFPLSRSTANGIWRRTRSLLVIWT